MTKTNEINEIEQYLKTMKHYHKNFHYRFVVNDAAAAAFIRLPDNDSEWTYTVFETVRELCEKYQYASPFFSVEQFPYYDMPETDGYPARYMGIDFSSYQYPQLYPAVINYFYLKLSQKNK